jgi:predicted nucleic acid-binding protein
LENDQIYVLDATVIIDICHGGVLRETLHMLGIAYSPDLVCGEAQDISASGLEALGLQIHHFTGDGLLHLQLTVASYKGLTHKDVAALLLASEKSAVLLTGDSKLRWHAHQMGLKVHGILWVLDCLIERRLLSFERAISVLEAIMANGSWLPESECSKRFEAWRNHID